MLYRHDVTILLQSTFSICRCTNFPAFSYPQATCLQLISRVTSKWVKVIALLDAKARQSTCTTGGLFRAYLILSQCTNLVAADMGCNSSKSRVHAGTDVKQRHPASITKLFINAGKLFRLALRLLMGEFLIDQTIDRAKVRRRLARWMEH